MSVLKRQASGFFFDLPTAISNLWRPLEGTAELPFSTNLSFFSPYVQICVSFEKQQRDEMGK